MAHYGTPNPPQFDLTNIRVPVHLFVGTSDELATVADAEKIYSLLVNSPNATMYTAPLGH